MELMDLLLQRNLNETKEVNLGGKLSAYPFTIRSLTSEEWEQARKQCVSYTKNSMDVSQGKLNSMVVLTGCVTPNFRDANFLKQAGLTLPMDLVNKVLKPGEIETLANEILEYSGFGKAEADIPKK